MKKGIENTNSFQKNLDESNRKPNKIWIDKDSEFYNNFYFEIKVRKRMVQKRMLNDLLEL